MEVLKLTSVRLSKSALANAAKLGRELGYYRTSEIIRLAVWIGLKFMKPGVIHQLVDMMWKEELGWKSYSPRDILRTTGE